MLQSSNEIGAIIVELAKLVILAMVLERALVLLFEYRWYEKILEGKGLKVPIAYIISLCVCLRMDFDILRALFEPDKSSTSLGLALTAAIVAGGSAGAITLFQGVLGFSKESQAKLKEVKIAEAGAKLAEAKSRRQKAEAEARIAAAEAKAREAEAKVRVKRAGGKQ